MFAALAGLSELVGGLLLVLGLLTPLGTAAVLAAMLVAMVSVHVKNGVFATNNGIEMAFLYAVAAVGIACTGGDAFSLDALLGLRFFAQPYVIGGLLVLALIGTILTLAMRRQDQPQTTATQS
jgi:uncharacterized membrane protein YphA (DoxX/SURF4 family)